MQGGMGSGQAHSSTVTVPLHCKSGACTSQRARCFMRTFILDDDVIDRSYPIFDRLNTTNEPR